MIDAILALLPALSPASPLLEQQRVAHPRHRTHRHRAARDHRVEQAQRGYAIASTRFVNGLGTQLEVNDAQVALTQARVNRIQSYYDYLIASVDLNEALGALPDYVPTTLKD